MNLSRIFSVSLMLEGEYGLRDAALSVPAMIGEKGVSEDPHPRAHEGGERGVLGAVRPAVIASVVRREVPA